MTTLVPNSQASGVEAYEDMFKEITKKLYGEEASQSLHTPMAHAALDVERSFTNLLSDRNVAQTTDFDHNAASGTAGGHIDNASTLKSDEHLTAFGLAALMQNGFATPNALLNSHTFQQMNKQNHHHGIASTANNLNAVSNAIGTVAPIHNNPNESIQEKCSAMQQQQQHPQHQQQQQQHGNDLNAWNSKSDAYQHTSKHYKSKKHEASSHHIANEHLKSSNSLNSNGNGAANQAANGNNGQSGLQKRYSCSNCPYSTDRRDLFTRHENIHKEDKPFHCYVCLKQFNRADHVKKHFLRMHRGLNYDIVRTKRSLPQTNNTTQSTTNQSVTGPYHTSIQNSHHQQMEATTQASIIDQTNHSHMSNAFNHSTTSGTAVSSHQNQSSQSNIKVEKRLGDKSAKKNDKRFLCCYCSWSGNDNWGLKRHLNTHTKPFVCGLCDYKAARSERLATHVFKVHNKKVCTKCNYLAENQTEYDAHVNTTHANEARVQRSNQTESRSPSTNTNAVRNVNSGFNGGNSFNTLPAATTSSSSSPGHAFGHWRSMIEGTGITSPSLSKSNGSSSSNQKRGAERLFQYFGADDSPEDDPEDYARQLQMAAISRNTASVAQDFHNAGGEKNIESQNANNQNIKIESRIQRRSQRYDDTDTNKFAKTTFPSKFGCEIDDNRIRCENVQPIYYYKSSTIVRQRISPPAKQMAYSNRLTDIEIETNTNSIKNTNINKDLLNRFNEIMNMEKPIQTKRLVSPKSDFDYYIRQMRLNESIPFDMMTMTKVYSKLRKLR